MACILVASWIVFKTYGLAMAKRARNGSKLNRHRIKISRSSREEGNKVTRTLILLYPIPYRHRERIMVDK